jgi:hypothetical protein
MKTMEKRTAVKLLVAALVATCLFAGIARAQSPRFVGKVTLPFDVRWGDHVLPPGEYMLRIDTIASPVRAIVQAENGKRQWVSVSTTVLADNEKGTSALFLTKVGNQYRVRTMNVAELGKLLIYEPFTKREQQILNEKRETQAVPIIAAKK